MSYGKTLKLTSSGDLYLNEFRQLVLIEGQEKVSQDITCILKTIKGENIYDRNFGLDMLVIKRGRNDMELIKTEISRALRQYKYLKSIDAITVGGIDEKRNVPVYIAVTTTDDEKIMQSVVLQ